MEDDLRLLIVADDPLVRAGLAMLLDKLLGCLVIEHISTVMADSFFDDNTLTTADVIIWDVGWETAVMLTETTHLPDWQTYPIPVIALISHEEESRTAWNSGVQAVLRRDSEPEALFATAQAVHYGLTVFDPQFAQTDTITPTIEPDPILDPLTPRELEVLQHLAEGLTNKGIAQQLGISDHTVKFHVNAIMSKLGAQSRTEAVVRATRQGHLLL